MQVWQTAWFAPEGYDDCITQVKVWNITKNDSILCCPSCINILEKAFVILTLRKNSISNPLFQIWIASTNFNSTKGTMSTECLWSCQSSPDKFNDLINELYMLIHASSLIHSYPSLLLNKPNKFNKPNKWYEDFRQTCIKTTLQHWCFSRFYQGSKIYSKKVDSHYEKSTKIEFTNYKKAVFRSTDFANIFAPYQCFQKPEAATGGIL